ncbi:MAG: sulfite exporter TauE/SafE family protein [Lachnospiraceae bacterium]|nr:sulfite exporter TauE/SafE family protein [Lachnospiraceae bacterium]
MYLCLFLLIVFLFNLIQIVGGFAGTMLAMPFTILLLGAEQARLVLNAVSIPCCVYPILRYHGVINWREAARISFFMIMGILISQKWIADLLLPQILVLYSIIVMAIALKNLFIKKIFCFPNLVSYLILLGAGIIHGAFLSGGALLVIYTMQRMKEKNEFRATISVVWLILNGFMLGVNIKQGNYHIEEWQLVLSGLIPAVFGILIGDRLQKKINDRNFHIFANVLLLFSGLTLFLSYI